MSLCVRMCEQNRDQRNEAEGSKGRENVLRGMQATVGWRETMRAGTRNRCQGQDAMQWR